MKKLLIGIIIVLIPTIACTDSYNKLKSLNWCVSGIDFGMTVYAVDLGVAKEINPLVKWYITNKYLRFPVFFLATLTFHLATDMILKANCRWGAIALQITKFVLTSCVIIHNLRVIR